MSVAVWLEVGGGFRRSTVCEHRFLQTLMEASPASATWPGGSRSTFRSAGRSGWAQRNAPCVEPRSASILRLVRVISLCRTEGSPGAARKEGGRGCAIRKHDTCRCPGHCTGCQRHKCQAPGCKEPGVAQAGALCPVPQVWPNLILWPSFLHVSPGRAEGPAGSAHRGAGSCQGLLSLTLCSANTVIDCIHTVIYRRSALPMASWGAGGPVSQPE